MNNYKEQFDKFLEFVWSSAEVKIEGIKARFNDTYPTDMMAQCIFHTLMIAYNMLVVLDTRLPEEGEHELVGEVARELHDVAYKMFSIY